MTAPRRSPWIAPDHPSAHVPPEHPSAPILGDQPSAHIPCDTDAVPMHGPRDTDGSMLTQGSRSADAPIPRASGATAALGGCERAVHDPQARAYYDAETGALLADEAAWERAGEDQRDKARARLAAVRRAEELNALGIPRCKADATAAKEAGIASGVLGRWRRKVRACPEAPASLRCSMPGVPDGLP